MTLKHWTIALIIGCLVAVIAVQQRPDSYRFKDNTLWQCSFDRLSGVYLTSGDQLNREHEYIIVQSGDRSFAFKRAAITNCRLVNK